VVPASNLNLCGNVSRASPPRVTNTGPTKGYRLVQNHVATKHEGSTVSISAWLNAV
jgi:hypothetical protein